jgi:uncharacterized protein (DUF736 family)
MNYENRPGDGVLFKNERKTSDKQPDYKGVYYDLIEGGLVERDMAAWVKTSKKGQKFLSIKVTDKFQPERREEQPPAADLDDAIPF